MSRFEDKVEQRLSQVNKGVRKVFSSGQTTADYIPFESLDRVKVHSLATKALSKRTSKWGLKRRHVTYWLMAFTIGLLTGVFAFFSSMGLGTVQKVRLAISLYFLNLFEDSAAGIFMAWLTFSMSSVILVITGSTLCTYVQPTAKGAGIAEVKAFLNGVKFPNFFSLRTLFVKLIAAICAVGGGLPMGQEGPMIHIGAMIGWNTSQMKFRKFPRLSSLFQKFQNDRDKRDFVASGAASGVAAAFGAPIGGTLFAFEEASSFWSMELIWRTFFACMVSAWSANFFIMGATEGLWKVIDQPSHVVYGVTLGKSYRVWEIFPFLLIGVIGGILGVLFIKIWQTLVPIKKKYIWTSNRNKVIEVAVLAFVVSSLAILLPLAFGCEPYSKIHPEDSFESSDESANEAFAFQIFNCKEGDYNQMASLWFTSPELTLKHLFVRNIPDALSVGPLLTFLILFFLAAAYGCGTWIAGGLLVPMLMIGATYGRLVGVITSKILPDSGVDPGVYAVLGATGFMGGVSRLTVALVLIMIEITSDLDALLPIMLVAMISKWVGDLFCHSLYDEQLHVNHVPFLEADPPRLASSMLVNEGMHGDIGFVYSNATVAQCVKAVEEFKFSDIPVVDSGNEGTAKYLIGSVPRVHLVTLLADRVWDDKKQRLMDVTVGERRFKAGIPKFEFSEEDLQSRIDLTPYINMATFSVQELFPLSLAYKVFRDQGLRQLFVVNDNNELVGMLNRDNLLLHEQHDTMIKNTSKAHERERMIQRKASILNQSSGNLNLSRPTTPKREHVEISVASPNVSLNNK